MKLLYLEEFTSIKGKKEVRFYLNMDSIVDGQVPYIYHVIILRLINKLVEKY